MLRYLGCAMVVAMLAAGLAEAGAGSAVRGAENTADTGTLGWRVDSGPVSVRIGLAGQDPAGLAAYARDVSTPGSGQYHHYLTPAQAQARFGATAAQLEAVRKWVDTAGLHVTGQDVHWIDATGNAAAVRKAFGARTRTLTPPLEVARAVANVAQLNRPRDHGMREGATGAIKARRGMTGHPVGTGTLGYGDRTPQAGAGQPVCSPTWGAATADPSLPRGYSTPEPLDVCGYIPSQLRTAYGVTASKLTGSGVAVAIVDAYGSATMLADANRFAKAHGDAPFAAKQYQETVTPSEWTHTDDGVCQAPADWAGEEALDVETVHGMAPGATVHYFGANSCADQDINATLADIVDTHAVDIVSSSFGETMHRTSVAVDAALVSQATQIFQYAATEGIGLYDATGDCGDDSSRSGPGCDPESAHAQTEWPASSPWVTGVGGTALALGTGAVPLWQASLGDRRSALSDDGKSWVPLPGDFYFGGGGGTSEDFPQPPYQKSVVPDALARTLGTGAKTANPMRTLPDVAMDGDLLTAVQVGATDPATGRYGETPVGGTSAATPMFAATQADAQQAQVASGGKPIGFANPDLYKRATPATFTDVVAHPAGAPTDISAVLDPGVNSQGKRQMRLFELGHDQGLAAGPGYDLATGLGSPRKEYLNSFKH